MDYKRFFSLKKPCPECPFLKVGGVELQPGRLDSIKRDLLVDDFSSFYCHKTIMQTTGRDGKEVHCAGAAAFLLAAKRINIPMRLAVMQKHLDLNELNSIVHLVDITPPSKKEDF